MGARPIPRTLTNDPLATRLEYWLFASFSLEKTGLDNALTQTGEIGSFGLFDERIRGVTIEFGLARETRVQLEAAPVILSGANTLIISPTGSGKTEAALLPIFHMILQNKSNREGISAIYVTPLRALNRDMLGRIEQWGRKLGITVEVRHGDTPQKDRRRQALHPPDILITTPETLQVLILGSRLREGLSNLRWIVVDEIHHLASDRRGAQLSLVLERIQQLIGKKTEIQRIGLSATVANPEEIARFLVGTERRYSIVDASSTAKGVEYRIEMPEPTEEDRKLASELYASSQAVARMARMADLIKGHESTLIFVNSRGNAEFLAARLGSFGVKVGVHHGSLPREERERVERELKIRAISAMVCTSTLELGIDIGSIDLVIQYMSPKQVNSLIQRVGRSGHALSRISEGVVLAVTPEDSLESIAISKEAIEGRLEPTIIHECALDVLCHQIAGSLLVSGKQNMKDILDLARKSYCYRNLDTGKLRSVIDYMQVLGYLRLEQTDQLIHPRFARCRNYYLENLSMIPDERRYNVIDLSSQQKVGILGEEFMALHAEVGVHFIVKGKVWQIESIQTENVYVTPVVDPTASIPGWDGELLPLPKNVAASVGQERRDIESKFEEGIEELTDDTRIWNADRNVRSFILNELNQQKITSAIPTDKRVVVEKFDRYLIIHTSAGERINLTLGEFFEEKLLRKGLMRHWWNDGYRIMVEMTTDESDLEEIVALLFSHDPATRGFMNAVIRKHFPFGYYMKFIAERFGALKRGLLLSGEGLKELTMKFRFTPVYEETLREALLLKVDVDGALELLRMCQSGDIEMKLVRSGPSPLGRYIFDRYAETDENYGSNSLDTIGSMRASISNEIVSLLCFKCGNLSEFVKVASIEENPKCSICNSGLLSVLFYGAKFTQGAFEKKHKQTTPLSSQERDALTKARRSADLVLSYGKQGVVAQCVYGIGPQTAAKVLSRMQSTEEDFYSDLLEAKLNFIRTRQYWD